MAFAIGVDHPKHEVNIGTLLRSAQALNARLFFTVGRRFEPRKQPGDTTKAYRHVPVLNFETWEEAGKHLPFAWVPVGIEIASGAKQLYEYRHPPSAVYILGAEDHGLSREAAALCRDVIVIPSAYCLNVAVAGSIVMYDRAIKKAAMV